MSFRVFNISFSTYLKGFYLFGRIGLGVYGKHNGASDGRPSLVIGLKIVVSNRNGRKVEIYLP